MTTTETANQGAISAAAKGVIVTRWRLTARWFWIGLCGLIGGLGLLFLVASEKQVPPWDPTSMVLLGRSLAREHSLQYFDVHNAEIGPYFNPHGFSIRAPFEAQPYSTFPPGWSLIIASVYVVTGGVDWLFIISPILTVLGLGAAAYLGYVLSGRWGSIFAVLLLGSSHVVVTFATSLWSDGPSLDLLLMGVALAIWAVRSNRRWAAASAGLCLGLVILFKFVNVIFVVLIVAVVFSFKRDRPRQMGWWLMPGIAAGAAGMLWYQVLAYGSPLANAYQPWGTSLYDFPLFSPTYLFFRSPRPWNDISSTAILTGMITELRIWAVVFLVGLVIDRKNPLRLLLALILVANVMLYAVSVFSPRQFINMRYLLPALAAAYMLAADVLARLMQRLSKRVLRAGVAGLVGVICLTNLWLTVLPDLNRRNTGTAAVIQQVQETARLLPPNSVVLAYALADSFILYGDRSVLNYRRVSAPDLAVRNTLVAQTITQLLCRGHAVYLIQDDERQFNSIFPDLSQAYNLQPKPAPLVMYELGLRLSDRRCFLPE